MEDSRTNQVNKFTAKIVDKQISRHPLRDNVIIVYNETDYDIYRDATSVETGRTNKLAIVEKDKDRFYVQEWEGDEPEFLEEDDRSPWMITMTMTGLERTPKQDDFIIIEGRKHTISRVKPIHIKVKSVITVLSYPEKNDEEDAFKLFKVLAYSNYKLITDLKNHYGEEVVFEVVYGGIPTFYKLDEGDWIPFKYKFKAILNYASKVQLKSGDVESEVYYLIP